MSTASQAGEVRLPNSPAQNARIREVLARGPVGVLRHCLTVGLDIRGKADGALLEERLARVIARRPALRCVFGEDGAHTALEHAPALVQHRRIEGATARARWELAIETADFEAQRPFALGQTPLVRSTLLTAEDDRHLLVINLDQLACDAWSANLVVADLLADAEDGDPPPRTDGYQTAWLGRESWRKSPDGQAAIERRRAAVRGALRGWPLSTEGDPGDPQTVVERFLALDDGAAAALLGQVRSARGSLLAVAAAALAAGVAEDPSTRLALRSTFAARESTAEERVVGWFANEAVLVLPPRRGTVLEYADTLRSSIFGALTDQRVSYPDLDDVLSSGPASAPSCALVFLPKTLSGGQQAGRLGDAGATRTAISVCPTGADIDFFLIEESPTTDGPRALLTIGATTSRGVATPEEVDRMLERWATALAALAVCDWRSTPIGAIPRRPDAAAWNNRPAGG